MGCTGEFCGAEWAKLSLRELWDVSPMRAHTRDSAILLVLYSCRWGRRRHRRYLVRDHCRWHFLLTKGVLSMLWFTERKKDRRSQVSSQHNLASVWTHKSCPIRSRSSNCSHVITKCQSVFSGAHLTNTAYTWLTLIN